MRCIVLSPLIYIVYGRLTIYWITLSVVFELQEVSEVCRSMNNSHPKEALTVLFFVFRYITQTLIVPSLILLIYTMKEEGRKCFI